MDKLKEITEELNNIFTVVGDIRSSVVRVTGTVALGVVIKNLMTILDLVNLERLQ